MIRIERRLETPRLLSFTVPAGSLVAAFVAGAVVLGATGHDPFSTYRRIVDRGFVSTGALSATIVTATPLLLTGLAAAVAFRMKVWNIGGEGQLYMGAIGASAAGIAVGGQSTIVVILAMVLAGGAAGALWAAIPGLLRAYLSTSEIITSLMLNYVGGLVLTYLIFDSRSYWRDLSSFNARVFPQGKTLSSHGMWRTFTADFDPAIVVLVVLAVGTVLWVWRCRRLAQQLLPDRRALAPFAAIAVLDVVWLVFTPNLNIIFPLGFFFGVAVAAFIWVLYGSTRYGFEVQVIGDSPSAAWFAGMRTKRKVVSVMVLSGAIAGLGGASQIGDFRHLLDPRGLQQVGYGYAGIVVAALARYNPLAVVVVAVLLGGLQNAGFSLQGPDFPAGLVGTLQGLILFSALGGELLLRYRFVLAVPRLRRRVAPPPEETAEAH